MAEKVTFKLKEPQSGISPSKQKETLIFLKYSFGLNNPDEKRKSKVNYTPLIYSSGLKIKPVFWNGKPYYRAKQSSKFNYRDFNRMLDYIENTAKSVYYRIITEEKVVTLDLLRKELNRKLKRTKQPEELDLNQFINHFITDIESGKRVTEKGKRYAFGTTKNYKGFQSQLDEFQASKGKLNYVDINSHFYDEFVLFFNKKEYSPNTIGRHIKNLKTIMRIAREDGLHNNYEIEKKKFKILKAKVKNIFLNEAELKKLADKDLSDNKQLEIARDVFLIGCYTAQRFSDYSRIKKENIKIQKKGDAVIELTQTKTGERCVIPVKPELDAILKKYNNNVPYIYEQKLNKLIKDIAEDVGIDETITTEITQGGVKKEKRVQKYELIKTHTARRSGITNMYIAGIPTIDIMKLSGHKTEREFLKYVNLTKEQTAQRLSSHSYFN